MDKPVYLGLSKILIHWFWYNYLKPKFGETKEICYIDTDCLFVYIKTGDIYKDIAEGVETRFGTSNMYQIDH